MTSLLSTVSGYLAKNFIPKVTRLSRFIDRFIINTFQAVYLECVILCNNLNYDM